MSNETNRSALEFHAKWRGKIEIASRVGTIDREALAVAYTPGVAAPCLAIQADPALSYEYTRRWNTVAVVTDGTAVLGLGDIGPEAGMPVMEGKCLLFKEFGGVDAIPLCIRSKDVDEIVNTVRLLEGSFGGVNLEDISAPRCFEIEERLKAECDIPIFHDDQHGTAVVVLAGLINACKLAGKAPENTKTVIIGAGAAGVAIAKILIRYGFGDILLLNRSGIIGRDTEYPSKILNEMAKITNKNNIKGTLAEAVKDADIFLGVSGADLLSEEMVRTMADKPIVFAMANPNPEIKPDLAKAAGAFVVATGRSDFPNQINNVLAFPGIFRGALDSRAKSITEEMKMAAAKAIAELVQGDALSPDYIIPSPFDERVAASVAKAVKKAAELEN